WDIATIEDHLPKTLTGTSGADTLYGGAGPDTFDGGAGNDTMYGYDGNDTYLFGPGSGQDTVLDFDPTAGNVDTIEMASGVAPSDVTVTHQQDLAAGVDDLVLSINGTSDQLTVQSFFTDPVFHVERVAFADGTVWDATELRDKTLRLWQGGPGNDFIVVPIFGFESNDNLVDGGAGDDFLDTSIGNNVLRGGEGNDGLFAGGHAYDYLGDGTGRDTYLFGRGSGQETIADAGNFGTDVNVIQMAADILPGDIEVTAQVDLTRGLPFGDNLALSLEGTTDQLILQGFFTEPFDQTYSVQFADGTTWDVATLKEKARFITGSDG